MFIIVELQTNHGVTANIVNTANTRQQAESVYHGILSSAAISNVEVHAAVILTDEGYPIAYQAYKHEPAVAGEG